MELPPAARTPKVLGKVGEKYVGLWASQSGITANLVQEDENGWDYYLELPRPRPAGRPRPLDLLPSTPSCFVQVKTLTSGDGRSRIKLSNWQKMVTQLTPWFVLVIILDHKNEATEAFLVHVDRDHVANVLKRLRELSPDLHDHLHEHSIDVSWESSDRLSDLHGSSLSTILQRHIGPDPSLYASRKNTWIKTVGYDTAIRRLHATVEASSSDEAKEMMVDLLVRLRDEVPCSSLALADIRFDIEGVSESLGEGTITVDHAPDGEATVCLSTEDGSQLAEVCCEYFSSKPHIPDLEERFHKHRLIAPFFSVLMQIDDDPDPAANSEVNLKLHWQLGPPHWEGRHLLKDLAVAGEAAALLRRSQDEAVSLHIRRGSRTLLSRDHFRVASTIDQGALEVWNTIAQSVAIARSYHLPDDLSVELDDLMSQASEIRLLRTLLTEPDHKFQWGAFTSDREALAIPSQIALVSVCVVTFNAWVLVRCFALIGSAVWSEQEDGRLRMTVPNAAARGFSDARATTFAEIEELHATMTASALVQLNSEGIAATVVPPDAP